MFSKVRSVAGRAFTEVTNVFDESSDDEDTGEWGEEEDLVQESSKADRSFCPQPETQKLEPQRNVPAERKESPQENIAERKEREGQHFRLI